VAELLETKASLSDCSQIRGIRNAYAAPRSICGTLHGSDMLFLEERGHQIAVRLNEPSSSRRFPQACRYIGKYIKCTDRRRTFDAPDVAEQGYYEVPPLSVRL